jgi:hypothetical protein
LTRSVVVGLSFGLVVGCSSSPGPVDGAVPAEVGHQRADGGSSGMASDGGAKVGDAAHVPLDALPHDDPDSGRTGARDASASWADAGDATVPDAHADGSGTKDAAEVADSGVDAAPVDAGTDVTVVAGTPAVTYVGRFDTSDPLGPQMAWPGTRIVARFDGTGAQVQLTQRDGYSGGPSWFNAIVDGVEGAPFSLEGTSQMITLASGLAPGAHVLQLEKRTEANLGTVRFEGFTFTGGTGLLAPPPPPTRRIEFMSDSTIDGFGILGNILTTCTTGDPPQYNDSRSSLAWVTSSALSADMVLSAYSGKGFTVDEDPTDTAYYETLYPRAIPDSSSSVWTFQTEIPDAVVMSLGGVDMDGQSTAPPGFQAAYDSFVGTVRGHYPHAAIWLTVWSQVKDDVIPTRTAMTTALQAIVSARNAAGDSNVFLYVFPESDEATDETGCEYHANAPFQAAMAALMVTEMKTRLGW